MEGSLARRIVGRDRLGEDGPEAGGCRTSRSSLRDFVSPLKLPWMRVGPGMMVGDAAVGTMVDISILVGRDTTGPSQGSYNVARCC